MEAIITIEPYSPIAREKAKVIPVSKAGKKEGKRTLLKVFQGEAPKDQAASSNSLSKRCNVGCKVLTTKGKDTKIIAILIANREKSTCIPNLANQLPNQPWLLKTVARVSPAIEVGMAKGKSTAASSQRFPKKLYRVNTQAKMKPKKPLI